MPVHSNNYVYPDTNKQNAEMRNSPEDTENNYVHVWRNGVQA